MIFRFKTAFGFSSRAKAGVSRYFHSFFSLRAGRARETLFSLPESCSFLYQSFFGLRRVGALLPSGNALATAMAHQVNPLIPGSVVELGSGTGAITEALLRRGVSQDRLVLVETNPDFISILRSKFPKARILRHDAYDINGIARQVDGPIAAIVSGLPLRNHSLSRRCSLLEHSLPFLTCGAPFIQFSYLPTPPIPRSKESAFLVHGTPYVWRNVFPARVWIYRGNPSAKSSPSL